MLMLVIITMNRRTAYMCNILNHLFQPPGPLPYFYCFSSNLHLASWQAENIRTTTRKFLLHIGGSLLCHGEHEFYFNTSTILQTVELIIFRRRVYNVPAHDIAGLISDEFDIFTLVTLCNTALEVTLGWMGGKGGQWEGLMFCNKRRNPFGTQGCDSICRWYPKGLIVYVFGTHGFDSLCALNFKRSSVELSCLEALSQVLSFKDCEI